MEPSSSAQDDGRARSKRSKLAGKWLRNTGLSHSATTAILLWSGCAACATAIVIPTILWADTARDAALSAARKNVSSSAAAGANSVDSLFGLIDVVLRRMSELAAGDEFGSASLDELCPSLICSNNQRLSPYLLLGFARANGDVVTYGPNTPSLNIADRDYFVAQKSGDVGLFVGAPRRTPFMTGLALPMSRRLPAKTDSFQGIVGAVINADQIRAVFQGVGAGNADRISLTNADGRSLIEWVADRGSETDSRNVTAPCGPAGKDARDETMAAAEKIKIGDLTVEVCRSKVNALRSWRRQVYLVAGFEGLLLAASALVLPAFGRRRARRLRQQMGLRGLVVGSSDVQFIIAAKPDGRFVLEALTFTRPGEFGRMSARLIGRTTREFFSPDDVDLIESDYRSVLASGQTRRIERRVRLGGGEFMWSTVLVPLNDGGGHDSYIFGAATELGGTGDSELEGGLRRFTDDVIRREDAERRRIARELHDTTGQNLIAAGFELGAIDRDLFDSPPHVRAAVAQARALIDASVSELRTLAYVLHPALLDEAGLGLALPTLAEGFEKRAGIRVVVTVAAELSGRRWPSEIEIALYRVAQEALTNVQRHSVTKSACLMLRPDASGRLELSVGDGTNQTSGDERPTSPLVEGAGIRGMRERIEGLGGSLVVAPSTDGFRITASVPVGAGPA
ncbi:PAS domain-containing protein [Methylobacterium sp. C25]|uniref:histidine kinase n=1 Tax=Methylobacterium sp. C25 TaxID=2721622 RepID=UPI001F2BBAA6|nr:histidine kinase [Methylobacterium sp. C25]MCE4223342.1 PAS domain-containing protein [Methylobacterium sp. C25]